MLSRRSILFALLHLGLGASPGQAWSGAEPASMGGYGPSGAPADSAALRSRAREAQDRFERLRRRSLPRDADRGRGTCSEVIGRFCLIYQGEDDWTPAPDPPEILQARDALLDTLNAVGEKIPGDRWVLSQRIFYLGEEGRWSEALELARSCGGQADAWWCFALRGLALHGSERFTRALRAFDGALRRMDADRARRWRDPEQILDDGAFDHWSDAGEEDRPRLRRRLWLLADPLYLVPGNDRLTAHYARHTVSWIRDDAANPHRVSWGWDLARILIRYGAELGWERQRPRATSLRAESVVGYHHPESKQYLPPAPVFEAPAELEAAEWHLEEDRPRTAYAPPYAPRMSTRPFQMARFRREGDLVLVAGFVLPADTAAGEGSRSGPSGPWGGPLQAGVFLADPDSGMVGEVRRSHRRKGALRLRAEAGSYLVSAEVWDPGTARAARSRQGVFLAPLPPDVAAISDLLVMDAGKRPPRSLDEAVPRVRPEVRACAGERITVGWELYGLGLNREPLVFRLRLVRADQGFFRRAGEWLGIVGGTAPVSLEWTEAGPDRLQPFFRAVDVTPPADAEAGTYELTLRTDLQGRTPLEARRTLRLGTSGCRPEES